MVLLHTSFAFASCVTSIFGKIRVPLKSLDLGEITNDPPSSEAGVCMYCVQWMCVAVIFTRNAL